ncbi:MAG: tetratricopeptide repeat protein [Pontiellaceae bacterium]|nr:tetratricopeptide repeat protein [Pontiellaceae bacterium]MBN2785005.1 tetratricopeptide repeat protein [Pontiellaceae bacterium]
MSKEKQHSPQHDALQKKKSLEQQEVKEVLQFIKKYGTPAGIAVVAVCAVVLVGKMNENSRMKKEAEADALLMSASSPEDYQTIVDSYEKTSSAPLAMMSLAMTRYNEGNYDAAFDLYSDFINRYSKNDMVMQAALNRITCRESKGEYSEAHLLYGKFISENPDSFLAPVAMMGQARCLEAMGSTAEAKRAYEDLVVNYPGSKWSNLAESRMKILGSKLQ